MATEISIYTTSLRLCVTPLYIYKKKRNKNMGVRHSL